MQKQKYIEEVLDKYSDMVYRIAITRCGTIENAEDVYQDVFMKFSERMPVFDNEEHEKAWFIRVTLNLSKNIKISAWNQRVVTLNENIQFETKEEANVFSAVCELPKNYKTVIYLMYYEGYKVKEIAKLISRSEGTVKTWLFRAREILKKNLEGGLENE